MRFMEAIKVEVVIAHYHERLDWMSKLTDGRIDRIFVYTKGRLDLPANKVRLKNSLRLCRTVALLRLGMFRRAIHHSFLPNVGREAQTYCHHCLTHYERLKSSGKRRLVLFLQGHPHVKNFADISGWLNHVQMSGARGTPNFVLGSANDYLTEGKQSWWRGFDVNDSGLGIEEWARRRLGRECNLTSYPIYWNACFGVTGDRIASREKTAYSELCSMDLSSRNPEAAYFLERLWYYWFNLDRL